MRFITTNDIETWANTVDCKYHLPHLIRKLILATVNQNQIKHIQFAYGEDVQTGGYDGELTSASENTFVPLGESVWEFGTTNNKKAKANEDYEKRKANPLGKIPSETTYININGKKYRDKNKWGAEKQAESFWKDVKYLDALDIEQWLELAPTTELWLAEKLRKPTLGIYTLEEYWKLWSENEYIKIVPDILLGESRLDEIDKIKTFLISKKNTLYIKSITIEEAIAFPIAVLKKHHEIPTNVIIIDNRESFNQFTQCREPLTIIVKFKIDNIDLSGANQRGHKVIIPISLGDESSSSDSIQLSIVNRNSFENGLNQMGVDSEQAKVLTKNSGRNISVLRRLLKFNDNTKPKYLDDIEIRDLIPILLANRFADYLDGDKEIIEKISGKSSDEYIGFLKILATLEDSPIYYINGVWRLVSPTDTFLFFAKYITQKDFKEFQEICLEVLTEVLHKYTLPLEERGNYYQTPENRTKYSPKLREGLCESLVIISVLGKNYGINSISNTTSYVDNIIKEILEKDVIVWRSLSSNLMLLAEAAPALFLDNLERIITDKNVNRFFEEKEGFIGKSNDLAPLLWCLDVIAWFPEHLVRASISLCELIKITPKNLPTSNTPLRSLKSVFRIWYPQTNTNAEDRKKILEVLIKKYPNIAYNLLYSLIKTRHDAAFHLPRPKWRLFSELREIQVTNQEVYYMRGFCLDNVITMSEGNIREILSLIDILDDIEWDKIDKSLDIIEKAIDTFSQSENNDVYQKFRGFIGRHRNHPNAHWSLPVNILDKIEGSAIKFKSDDIILNDSYLFKEHNPEFIEGKQEDDYRKRQEQIEKKRLDFVQEVIDRSGICKIFELAVQTKYPFIYGQILAKSDKLTEQDAITVYKLINSKEESLIILVTDFIRASERKTDLKTQLQILDKLEVSKQEKVTFFIALNSNLELWTYINDLEDEEIEKPYWQSRQGFLYADSKDELFYALQKLAHYKKALTYLNTLGWGTYVHKNILTSDEVLKALEDLSLNEIEDSSHIDHFRNILDFLYSKNDYNLERGAKIDMKFLFIFSGGSYGQKPQNLYRLMAKKPNEYFEVLSQIYLPKNEETKQLELQKLKKNPYHQEVLKVSWDVFDNFNLIPSAQDDGTLNYEELSTWISEVRNLAIKNDRIDVTDSCIGKLLAKHPINMKDIQGYPIEIYDVLEKINNKYITESFKVQISNNLSFTSRGAFEGGNIERLRANFFNTLFETIKFTHPKTSWIFKSLEKKYLTKADWEDESALQRSLE
jgi:hypothetical protein